MKPFENSPGVSGFRMGDCVFEPEYNRLISQQGEEHFIESRLAKILVTLLSANGSVVRRQELIEAVWSDVQVNEESLTKGIFDLRRFCEEKAIAQIEIRTIRNVGYQLKVDVAPRSTIDAKRSIQVLVLKGVLVVFLLWSFLVLLVRAISYEN